MKTKISTIEHETIRTLPIELKRLFWQKKLSTPEWLASRVYMDEFEQILLRDRTVLLPILKWEFLSKESRDSWAKRRPLDAGFNMGAHYVLNWLNSYLPIVIQKEGERNNKRINEIIKLHLETIAKLPEKIQPLFRKVLLSEFKAGTVRQVELRLRRSDSKSPPPELAALVRYINEISEEGKLATPERLARKLNIHRANLSRVIERGRKWGIKIQAQEDSRGKPYYTISRRVRKGRRYT